MSGLHPKKTLVPVDFSDLSFAAVDRAVEIAGTDGAVAVIYVLTKLTAMEPGNLYGTVTDDSRIEAVSKNLRERLAEKNYTNVVIHVEIGDAGREIAAFAENNGFDLIVIPSHGYGFVKHMLIGSVAERVVRLAHCPVLVLRS